MHQRTPRWSKRRLWFLSTIGLTILFIGLSAPNLKNHPIVTSDEVWLMSVAYKLTTHGVLGSDMFRGFFNAEEHHVVRPIHYLLMAASFKVAGPGIAQARWASLLSGVALLWTVGWVAFRWYGLAVALLAEALLLFWRSVLVALSPGLPLLAAARSARYDMEAVLWMWLAIGLLGIALRRLHTLTALAAGVCTALAALTQFYGIFVVPVIGVAWIWERGRRVFTDLMTYGFIAGFFLVMIPYVLYLLPHLDDLTNQMRFASQGRLPDLSGSALLNAPLHELRRFAHLLPKRTPGPWLLALGIWPALVSLWLRVKRQGHPEDRLLLLSLFLFEGLLMFLEPTKASVYALVLLPSLCLVMALYGVSLLRRAWHATGRLQRVIKYLVPGLLILVCLESVAAYAIDQQRSSQVSAYQEVGARIKTYLPPNVRIAGPEQWWWALRDHPYLAANNLFFQWRLAEQTRPGSASFSFFVNQAQITYFIVNESVDVLRQPDALRQQFLDFMASSCTRVTTLHDKTYGTTIIYRVLEKVPGTDQNHP